MAAWEKVANVWKNIQEVDLRPIRREAEQRTLIALAGQPGSGRRALAAQLSTDAAAHPALVPIPSALLVIDLDHATGTLSPDLIILLIGGNQQIVTAEKEFANRWIAAGQKVLVLYNQPAGTDDRPIDSWQDWGTARVLYGPLEDPEFLLSGLAPVLLELLPGRILSLGRHIPLLRPALAQHLINETCFSNAVYAFGTGLAEIVPVLDIPLNIADIFVLTKAQALLVYRLGLLLGLSTEWRYYVAEFGGVVGSGFLWRQAARQLVGLIPVWGIIPKVAVAYAGTYVVGHVVLRWHQTGRHITRRELGALYRQAFSRGKDLARALASRAPRPRLRRRKPATLPDAAHTLHCPACQTPNEADANFCKICGTALAPDRPG